MKTVKCLVAAALSTAMLMGSTSMAFAETKVLRFAHDNKTDPFENPAHACTAVFANIVEADTNGEIKVEVYPSNQLGSAAEHVQMVRTYFSAGEGAVLPLRFGGKTGARAGSPIDAEVRVKKLEHNAWQYFGESIVPLGDCAVIELPGGGEVILNTNRSQSFDPSLLSNMGIDPASKKFLFIKSTNHFYDAFAKIAGEIIYFDVHGPYPSDPKTNGYRHVKRPLWPIVEDPFAASKAS